MKINGYNNDGSISIILDGVEWNVPDDSSNRLRQMIAEWEFAKNGKRMNTIPPYIEPEISEDILWEEIRLERDKILSASDWSQLSDSPVDKILWANYRQKLRDLTETFERPSDVIWPEKP